MRRKSLYIVILLAFIALSGIIVLQIYWVDKAYTLEEKQFNDRVVITLSNVVDRILELNDDPSSVEPVKQVSNNFFEANVNDTLYPYLLESLLREEFSRANLKTEFEYSIYNCFNDSIVFGSRVSFVDSVVNPVHDKDIFIRNDFEKDGHYFGIYFPEKKNFLIRNMDFWVFSSVMILVVVMFFLYSISVMLRQKRLSEVKTDFINNMTHELKTPISTIALSTEVLLKPDISKDPERLKRYATIIQNENQRLRSQVDRVLQVASLTPDKLNIKKAVLDMHEIVSRAIQAFAIKVDRSDVFRTHFNAQNHTIEGDEIHINNIIHSLLDNACKYSGEDVRIDISTKNEGSWIIIEIQDNGIGIEKQHQKMIFDKFFRVPTGDQHDVKGFGLGLYYVKTVIEAHGGKVDVQSEKGKGSTFTIWLKTEK